MITRTERTLRNGTETEKPKASQISAGHIESFIRCDLRSKFTVISVNETDRATEVVLEKRDKYSNEIRVTYTGPKKLFRKALTLLNTNRVAAALS